MFIKSRYIVLENEIVEDGILEIREGIVQSIYKNPSDISRILEGVEEVSFTKWKKKEESSNYENRICINFGENIISPGFVDTHIHGYMGCDIMDNSVEAIKTISREVLNIGVTSFLATTLTASEETLDEVVSTIAKAKEECEGAKIRGIFLEGPFFTEKHKGAQNPEYFSSPNIKALKKWQLSANGLIKKIAIAPEYEGSCEFIKQAKEIGINVALGHSDATYEEASNAVKSGANIFVHTYNAMSPLHHRNPGMVGAAFTHDESYAELICDGHHVHPAAADVLMRCKGYEKIVLITDCMMAGGMKDGEYKLGEFEVYVGDGTARLKEGNLAGSILKLKDGIKNIINWGLATPFEAIQMASLMPAKSVGIDDVCGKIDIGRDADFAIINSETYDIEAVMSSGNLVIYNI